MIDLLKIAMKLMQNMADSYNESNKVITDLLSEPTPDLMDVASKLNRIRDQYYIGIYDVINDLQRLYAKSQTKGDK